MACSRARCIAQLFFFTAFVSLSLSQDSPSFCNRLYHSTVITNGKLFVDGGELRTVRYAIQSDIRNLIDHSQISNGNVIASVPNVVDWLELSKPFTNTDTSIWGHIPKNLTSPGNNAPSLNDGSMWASNSSFYLFGGALSLASGAPEVPPANGIWQYDLNNKQWEVASTSGQSVQRIHWGQSVQSVENTVGYFLGGAITPKSDPTFNAIPNAQPYFVQGLITFDESTQGLLNSSTSSLNQDGTAVGSFVTLIESLGSEGVLVAFGGVMNTPGTPTGLGDEDLADPTMHWQLNNISVYDISSQKWYQQSATGDVPPWRYVGCSVVVSAPDKSSYSIYLFGGWGNNSGDSDGFVYVLSVPSFRWIRVNQDSALRARHQCNLIGKHTMLVVGGIRPMDTSLQPSGSRGCDTSAMFSNGLGMFNMNNHSWVTSYDPIEAAAPYQVHPSIQQVIGGDGNGGATMKTPVNGFSEDALKALLDVQLNSNTTSNATIHSGSTPGGHKLSSAGIAGIAIAAVVVVLFLALTAFFIIRHRRREQKSPTGIPETPRRKYAEMGSSSYGSELSDGSIPAVELESSDKPLPPRPFDGKPPEIRYEMEGELGWHPAERSPMQQHNKVKEDAGPVW